MPAGARYVKRNRSAFADHLVREAQGLEALREAAAGTGIDVPEVLQVDERTLTLPAIETARCSPQQWARLGEGLAAIHDRPQARFGFGHDNYIGLSPQPNGFADDWGGFFLRRRLEFQAGRISDARLRARYSGRLQACSARLREFLDAGAVSPGLVHGDLWSGNVLCGGDGRVWLIDPACYFGDPDVDLAMSEMFGGFAPPFTAAYRAKRPQPAQWDGKRRIYNLYHYLNHLNLFGDAYLDGCEDGFAALESL